MAANNSNLGSIVVFSFCFASFRCFSSWSPLSCKFISSSLPWLNPKAWHRHQLIVSSFSARKKTLANFSRASSPQSIIYWGCKFFPQTGSIALYVLVVESFDAPVRATGSALVLGLGRLGASVAPVFYEAGMNWWILMDFYGGLLHFTCKNHHKEKMHGVY